MICVTLFLISKKQINVKNDSIIIKTGDYSFGMYLSHVLVLKVIKEILSYFYLPYILNIILICSLTYIITYLMNKVYYEKIKGRLAWKQ